VISHRKEQTVAIILLLPLDPPGSETETPFHGHSENVMPGVPRCKMIKAEGAWRDTTGRAYSKFVRQVRRIIQSALKIGQVDAAISRNNFEEQRL
jgi:hypothetical protein